MVNLHLEREDLKKANECKATVGTEMAAGEQMAPDALPHH